MQVSRTTVARTVVALAFAASAAQASAQETPSNIRFGIWYPYVSQNGVPPQEAFAARGITATFIQGDLTPETLASYDVVFFGRSGMLGSSNYGTPGAITDIQAVVDWVAAGGAIIGESDAFICDSIARGADWSQRLGAVAGVTGNCDSWDTYGSDLPVTITLTDHAIAQGVAPAFTLGGGQANAADARVDANNPNAMVLGTVEHMSQLSHMVVASYGAGCSVYFPTATGLTGSMDWSANADYQTLFVNAVEWAGTCGGSIASLYSTGLDDGRRRISAGKDPHYTLIRVDAPGAWDGTYAMPPAAAYTYADLGAENHPEIVQSPLTWAWVQNSNASSWISYEASQGLSQFSQGLYVYQTTFDLTGFDPASVRIAGVWGTDDPGWAFLNLDDPTVLDPARLVIAGGGFSSLPTFEIAGANGLFRPGKNTLTFVVWDQGMCVTGLRFEVQAATATPDRLPPVTTLSLDGVVGNAGWFRSRPVATLTAVDPGPSGSGVRSTSYQLDSGPLTPYVGPFPIVNEGGTSVCFSSTDRALNAEPLTCAAPVMVDTVAPTIAIAAPAAAEYLLRQQVVASFSVSELSPVGSGVDPATVAGTVPSGSPVDTASVGSKSFTVSAKDVAGNPASQTVSYAVRYQWPGFSSPKTTTEKIGNIIPIKFKVVDAAGATVANATPRLSLRSPTGTVTDKGVIRFDTLEQQYVYQLATKGFAAGAWTFTVDLGDGSPAKSVSMTLSVK